MIQLFHVKKSYAGDAPVLDDITLRIEKGEFCWLTGPSGAGKSTLLKLLFCAESPSSGQILIGGRNIGRIAQGAVPYLRRNIGVVFQDFKLLTDSTLQLLFDANARGTTVIVATHDRTLLTRYRKRTIGLEKGKLVFDA